MAKNYVLIDNNKLRKDVEIRNREIGDGVSMSERLDVNGIGNAVFANATAKFKRDCYSKKIDLNRYEKCENPSMMPLIALNSLCLLFGLNKDDYILKFKSEIKSIKAITGKDLVDGNYDGAKIDEIITNLEKGNGIQENILNDMVMCISNLASRVNDITTSIETLSRIQSREVDYLSAMLDGIDKLNEKWK